MASCAQPGDPVRAAPPDHAALEGVLRFSDLAAAERSIRTLEGLRCRFAAAGDREGLARCRELGRLGRRRAGAVARNPRVRPEQRLQKAEIASWFEIWLETPGLFDSWLDLRKRSQEFRRLAAAGAERDPDAP